jgi:phosphoadenosine phosphosulfate reductase
MIEPRIGIQFSGGKASLAVLYLCRPILDRATVYFGDTGIVYPHMVEFVHRTCAKLGAKLKVISPPMPIEKWQAERGLPSDLLPIEATWEMAALKGPNHSPQKLQTIFSCCGHMLWMPIHNAMIEDGIQVIIRGSKASDHHVTTPDRHVDERGVLYSNPIWKWTDDEVFAFLKKVGAEIPDHYTVTNNSFDCILCTAFLNSPGASERLKYTKLKYPDVWPELRRRLNVVREVIDSEREKLDEAFVETA